MTGKIQDAPNHPGRSQVFGEALSLGKLPPTAERLLDSTGTNVGKLCSDLTWQPRILILTFERLVIAHPGHDEVSDQIPLVKKSPLNKQKQCFKADDACFVCLSGDILSFDTNLLSDCAARSHLL